MQITIILVIWGLFDVVDGLMGIGQEGIKNPRCDKHRGVNLGRVYGTMTTI